MAKTKIICTLGPASSGIATLKKMAAAGMDIARLNFSHGNSREHLTLINRVRKINRTWHRPIKILLDLEGPRIRIGRLQNHKPIPLKKGQIIWLTQENIVGKGNIIPFDYEGPLETIKGADFIYVDDGLISLTIKKITKNLIKTEVSWNCLLKEHKGINIPGANLEFSELSDKDKDDIAFGIHNRVDYIAQSFVRAPENITDIRALIKNKLPSCRIIAKIENWDGIHNIDEIIKVADGIMVARGDMGAAIPIYEVPIVQKKIISKCNHAKKFVITATQMLESMVENIIPTRAEVTDVANAILDGTDFVMLSAETAAGKHPVETIRMMSNIVEFTEQAGLLL